MVKISVPWYCVSSLPTLLVPVRKYWVWRGWTDTDLGWILSQSLQVVTGLSQPTLLSTITTLPRSPWLIRKVLAQI